MTVTIFNMDVIGLSSDTVDNWLITYVQSASNVDPQLPPSCFERLGSARYAQDRWELRLRLSLHHTSSIFCFKDGI